MYNPDNYPKNRSINYCTFLEDLVFAGVLPSSTRSSNVSAGAKNVTKRLTAAFGKSSIMSKQSKDDRPTLPTVVDVEV